ncbi:Dynein light chain Tctex-1 like protein [Aduncisulcus paluster]|uniref:Dynein light chain Tctex-1 like protein n=1 Tax=Aduncisulcus paluster TaxID=2918883 RepID=A0ABQ5KVT5_9EUKA|nr:Dynein light chain Tctex-1 like protein [Aduncisulcus paluster]
MEEETHTTGNTYILPPPEVKFSRSIFRKAISEGLEKLTEDFKYDAAKVGDVTMSLAHNLQKYIRDVIPPRYKVVIQVLIVQNKEQGLRCATRGLWDPSTDNCVSVAVDKDDCKIVAIVFGVYTC